MNLPSYYFLALVKIEKNIEILSQKIYQTCKKNQPSCLSYGWNKIGTKTFQFHLSSNSKVEVETQLLLLNIIQSFDGEVLFCNSSIGHNQKPNYESIIIADIEQDLDWDNPLLEEFQKSCQEIIYCFGQDVHFRMTKNGRFIGVVLDSVKIESINALRESIITIVKNNFQYISTFSNWRHQPKEATSA